MRLLDFGAMAKAQKCYVKLPELIVKLFLLGVCLAVEAMVLVAVWMP
jgi:hypothetical protein